MAKFKRSDNDVLYLEMNLEEAVATKADLTCGLCRKRMTDTICKPINLYAQNVCPSCIGRWGRNCNKQQYRQNFMESGEEKIFKAQCTRILRNNGYNITDWS